MCNRPISQAAATMPAGHDKSEPFKGGPVGPTCARRAGLFPGRTLFDRVPRVRIFTNCEPRRDKRQMDLLESAP